VGTARGSRLAPDQRRDHLIAMGLELLGRRPNDQMSITELAEAAGISKGLLYHYFPTKSDFVIAVLRRSREDLERRMALDPSLSAEAALDAGLDGFLSFVEDHAAGYQAIAHARSGEDEAIRAELAHGRRRRIAMLTGLAARLAGSDRGDVASPALEAVLGGWLAFSETVVVGWLSERELARDEVRRLLRRALLAALGSVTEVDPRPAAVRLAAAADRAVRSARP
jgi:AcrR family transcriptional regulator